MKKFIDRFAMKVDYSDYLILAMVAFATALWFSKGKLWSVPKKEQPKFASSLRQGKTRNIVEWMQQQVRSISACYILSVAS